MATITESPSQDVIVFPNVMKISIKMKIRGGGIKRVIYTVVYTRR